MTALLSKFGLPLIIAIGSFGGGYYLSERLQKPVDYDKVRQIVQAEIAKIPKTECPPTTEIKWQELDMSNLKKMRNATINYSPQIHNPVLKFVSTDSTLFDYAAKQAGYKR